MLDFRIGEYLRECPLSPAREAELRRTLQLLRPFEDQFLETAPLAEYLAVNRTILTSEAFAIHEQWMRERPEDYGALARERLEALSVSVRRGPRCRISRRRWRRQLRA